MPKPRSDRELTRVNLMLDKLDHEWLQSAYGYQGVSDTVRKLIKSLRRKVEAASDQR